MTRRRPSNLQWRVRRLGASDRPWLCSLDPRAYTANRDDALVFDTRAEAAGICQAGDLLAWSIPGLPGDCSADGG